MACSKSPSIWTSWPSSTDENDAQAHGLDHSLLIAGLESSLQDQAGTPSRQNGQNIDHSTDPRQRRSLPAGADVAPHDWIYYSASTENVKGKEFALNLGM